ncbi:MAG: hypothetical protein ACTS4V_00590 [Candidatus Hodgkinia cicadicola]
MCRCFHLSKEVTFVKEVKQVYVSSISAGSANTELRSYPPLASEGQFPLRMEIKRRKGRFPSKVGGGAERRRERTRKGDRFFVLN